MRRSGACPRRFKTKTRALPKRFPPGKGLGVNPIARAKVLAGEGGEVWAPMALSDGKLILRDQHRTKCLDIRNP